MHEKQKYYCLSWKDVLAGYSCGIFPMGVDENSINWYEANPRAILPIELPSSRLHITRSLTQTLKKNPYKIKVDIAFGEVIRKCASRHNTWINSIIIGAYEELYRKGFAHSVEAWKDGKLVGGLYGVALKSAFFGESMFHTESNASKICVISLYEILKKNNFILFDIQMMTPVFMRFGAIEVSKKSYLELLERAMKINNRFTD